MENCDGRDLLPSLQRAGSCGDRSGSGIRWSHRPQPLGYAIRGQIRRLAAANRNYLTGPAAIPRAGLRRVALGGEVSADDSDHFRGRQAGQDRDDTRKVSKRAILQPRPAALRSSKGAAIDPPLSPPFGGLNDSL